MLLAALIWIARVPIALGNEAVDQESPRAPDAAEPLSVRVSWGHQSISARAFYVRPLGQEITIESLTPLQFETNDVLDRDTCTTHAGDGDVDGITLMLRYPTRPIQTSTNLHRIWQYLLDHSDSDTAGRLRADPGCRPDSRKLTIQMDREGTSGFSVTLDQLLQQRNFWVPELDVFISAADPPLAFADYSSQLAPWRGKRILDQVEHEPEATYEQYATRWEDMGSPAYHNPNSVWPGHIVGLTWDSAIAKFGVDRGGNVWNDYGNPAHFYLGFSFGDLSAHLEQAWKGQHLADGLPILTTTIERDGVRYEAEQFAYPLHGPPGERRGEIPMVLMEKLRLIELNGRTRTVTLNLTHRRERPQKGSGIEVRPTESAWIWCDPAADSVWLAVQGQSVTVRSNTVLAGSWTTNLSLLDVDLSAHGSRELILKMPSAPLDLTEQPTLAKLNYQAARGTTVQFWSSYLAQGARFNVPEEPVNTLFRASLWHALRLPRRHGTNGPDVKIDLPYSNFAYDQRGTPWPVNQAVYVDYMLYDFRGYHAISAEELAGIYHNNHEPNGHVGGFANWGVYTPGMIYTVAQHYLLSGDRASFENLLPQTLKAMDWCVAEATRTAQLDRAPGLMLAPLNDLSHEPRAWSFNQAYLFAGLDLLAKALKGIGHPRAGECRQASRAVFEAVQRNLARASVLSPLVQLRDHTWVPYVPCDALTPRRLMDTWYPTDVDTGSLHLSRLKALDPGGALTTYLLQDHEDNLFLNGWGMANEPVYNQQATAYLLRDNPRAAVRAFYSMLACAFSHSVFEPVEHRWAWGQYFGPPSTDGAWFELYRHMLIHELDDGSLLLGQATPRKWLEHGKRISVERAPTYYGLLDLSIESRANKDEIRADIKLGRGKAPACLLLRLRHPGQKVLRSVLINGLAWKDFDPAKEWVRIPEPRAARYSVLAHYDR